MKIDWKKFFYFVAGAVALEVLYKASTSSVPDASESGGFMDTLNALTGNKVHDFLVKIDSAAKIVESETGIKSAVSKMQSALESGWGTSGLTKNYNNLFGYTAESWLNTYLTQKEFPTNLDMTTIMEMDLSAAPFIIMKTHEESPYPPEKIQYFTRPGDVISKVANSGGGSDLYIYRPFRRYNSWTDSLRDWARLMQTARYASALPYAKSGDITNFAAAVASAGYATESNYAALLVSVANQIEGTRLT